MDWLYDNTVDSFLVRIGDFIEPRGILLDDITEATFMVKAAKADTDASALVTLTLGAGLTLEPGISESEATLNVQFQTGDFGTGKLETSNRYYTGMGIKKAGWTKFLEIRLADDRLKILPDFVHD